WTWSSACATTWPSSPKGRSAPPAPWRKCGPETLWRTGSSSWSADVNTRKDCRGCAPRPPPTEAARQHAAQERVADDRDDSGLPVRAVHGGHDHRRGDRRWGRRARTHAVDHRGRRGGHRARVVDHSYSVLRRRRDLGPAPLRAVRDPAAHADGRPVRGRSDHDSGGHDRAGGGRTVAGVVAYARDRPGGAGGWAAGRGHLRDRIAGVDDGAHAAAGFAALPR